MKNVYLSLRTQKNTRLFSQAFILSSSYILFSINNSWATGRAARIYLRIRRIYMYTYSRRTRGCDVCACTVRVLHKFRDVVCTQYYIHIYIIQVYVYNLYACSLYLYSILYILYSIRRGLTDSAGDIIYRLSNTSECY